MEYKSLIQKLTVLAIVADVAISVTSCGTTETKKSINSNLSHPIELVEDNNKVTNDVAAESLVTISNEDKHTNTSVAITTQAVSKSISTSKQASIETEFDSVNTTVESSDRLIFNDNNISDVISSNCDTINQVTTYSNSEKQTASTNITQKYVQQGDGDVLIIAEVYEQMGNQPFRVSEEEAEMLINMFNEIELVPVDNPVPVDDPLDEIWGGGYIMYIEGRNKITIMGNRNVKIDDNYYYDTNNKSDALNAQIGYVLYSYYGES